ncbi:MAG: Tripartite ATP-independent periplasmic transporter [Firmicutes bacterium ADurb.Bin373]|nr:MAG: Tripartite ATP-independent periplasmic transporter [Firmicutes bacterium ADurb.Bin373]
MKMSSGLVTGVSRALDRAAGFVLAATMVLIVVNVLFTTILKKPVFGAYEYVGLLTASAIGLSLAHCGAQNAHIDISLVVDWLPAGLRAVLSVLINLISMCFLAVSAWYVGAYARSMMESGLVTSTTQIPIYPFVYLIALGMLIYCLVLLVRVVESVIKMVNENVSGDRVYRLSSIESVIKAANEK